MSSNPKSPRFLRDPYLWLTLLLSLPVVGPLLQPGYFWGAHDARHSVYFLYQFDKAIQDGVLYPRWAPDFAFGYGYPFFNIYGPSPPISARRCTCRVLIWSPRSNWSLACPPCSPG